LPGLILPLFSLFYLPSKNGMISLSLSRRNIVEPVILRDIPFQIDLEDLKKKLRLKDASPFIQDVTRLAEEALNIGKPKAIYKLAFIEEKSEDRVVIDGVGFESHILRVNLDQAQRVFPYVASCGMELEDWANRIEDTLLRFWAETIKEMVLRYAYARMEEDLIERYRPGKLSRMSPGSLADWPLQEQRPLFKLVENAEEAIGVRLNESLLMIPTKSVSGIRFPTEESFESCQLCPREICPNRRAPYDPGLYERKFSKKES
jgi:hypothetical protein